MQAHAHSRFVGMSPFKLRRVVALIKGKNVKDALNILHFTRKNAARPIYKTIHSAYSNLVENQDADRVEMEDVFISAAYVDGGSTVKRFRPMSMGRAGKIRKRTSHITIVVEAQTKS